MQIDAFEKTAIWPNLEELGTLLSGWDNSTTGVEHEIGTISALHDHALGLRDVDPHLVDEGQLNNLSASIASVVSAFRASMAADSIDRSQLNNALAHANSAITYFHCLPPISADSATAATKRAATRYRKGLDAELEKVREEIATVIEGVDAAGAASSASLAALEVTLSAIQARAEESLSVTQDQIARLNSQLDEQRISFEQSNLVRSQAFEKEVADSRKALQDFLIAQAENVRESEDAASSKRQEVLAVLERDLRTSEGLIDQTSRNAIAADYGQWANLQGKSAFKWTCAAVSFAVLTAIALVIAVAFSDLSDDSVQFMVAKGSVGLVGLIVAGYCAHQAAEHRHQERVAKRLHLDLNALEPFLRHVENPGDLRAQIANRVFAPAEPTAAPRRALLQRGLSVEEVLHLLGAAGKPPEGPSSE